MKRFVCVVGALFLCGCGGGDNGGGSLTFYTVNAATGSDVNGDGVTVPYKTITKALSMASYGDNVTVAPGQYDEALGEIFPIVIPAGVNLIGDEANKGNGPPQTLIHGSGTIAGIVGRGITIYPMNFTTISGFTIRADYVAGRIPTPVVLGGSAVSVKNNRISNAEIAIWVDGVGYDSLIAGNVIQSNGLGIWFSGGAAASTQVERNDIRYNGTGVAYDSGSVSGDLGGGPTGSAGQNIIAGNRVQDLFTSLPDTARIYAANNYWDHVPPTRGTTDLGGFDIVSWYATTIATKGAMLAP